MTDQQQKNELRCRKCSRLLMKGEVKAIEIKCPKCGFLQTFHQIPNEKEYKKRKPLSVILKKDLSF